MSQGLVFYLMIFICVSMFLAGGCLTLSYVWLARNRPALSSKLVPKGDESHRRIAGRVALCGFQGVLMILFGLVAVQMVFAKYPVRN